MYGTTSADANARLSTTLTLKRYTQPGTNDSTVSVDRFVARTNGATPQELFTTDHWYSSSGVPEYGAMDRGPMVSALLLVRADSDDGPVYGIAKAHDNDTASDTMPGNASCGSDASTTATPVLAIRHANDGVPVRDDRNAGTVSGLTLAVDGVTTSDAHAENAGGNGTDTLRDNTPTISTPSPA